MVLQTLNQKHSILEGLPLSFWSKVNIRVTQSREKENVSRDPVKTNIITSYDSMRHLISHGFETEQSQK